MKEYIYKLEQSVISVCDKMGVAGVRSCDPGVWVGNDKICAIGRQWQHFTPLHYHVYCVNRYTSD